MTWRTQIAASVIRLLKCERKGFPRSQYDINNTLFLYWKIRDELNSTGNFVLYGVRVVVPGALRCTASTAVIAEQMPPRDV